MYKNNLKSLEIKWKVKEIIEIVWKSLKIIKEQMKMKGNHKKYIKIFENQIKGNHRKYAKIVENHSNKLIENQRKS